MLDTPIRGLCPMQLNLILAGTVGVAGTQTSFCKVPFSTSVTFNDMWHVIRNFFKVMNKNMEAHLYCLNLTLYLISSKTVKQEKENYFIWKVRIKTVFIIN